MSQCYGIGVGETGYFTLSNTPIPTESFHGLARWAFLYPDWRRLQVPCKANNRTRLDIRKGFFQGWSTIEWRPNSRIQKRCRTRTICAILVLLRQVPDWRSPIAGSRNLFWLLCSGRVPSKPASLAPCIQDHDGNNPGGSFQEAIATGMSKRVCEWEGDESWARCHDGTWPPSQTSQGLNWQISKLCFPLHRALIGVVYSVRHCRIKCLCEP